MDTVHLRPQFKIDNDKWDTRFRIDLGLPQNNPDAKPSNEMELAFLSKEEPLVATLRTQNLARDDWQVNPNIYYTVKPLESLVQPSNDFRKIISTLSIRGGAEPLITPTGTHMNGQIKVGLDFSIPGMDWAGTSHQFIQENIGEATHTKHSYFWIGAGKYIDGYNVKLEVGTFTANETIPRYFKNIGIKLTISKGLGELRWWK